MNISNPNEPNFQELEIECLFVLSSLVIKSFSHLGSVLSVYHLDEIIDHFKNDVNSALERVNENVDETHLLFVVLSSSDDSVFCSCESFKNVIAELMGPIQMAIKLRPMCMLLYVVPRQ